MDIKSWGAQLISLLMRATSMPACASFSMASFNSDAGPIVAIILVRMRFID
jgi:hypothetical protein